MALKYAIVLPMNPSDTKNPKPKILHIIPALEQGGAEVILSQITRFEDADHHILCLLTTKPAFEFQANITSLNLSRNPLLFLLNLPVILWRICKYIDLHRPDVVHGWLDVGNLLAGIGKFYRMPVVWDIHCTELPGLRLRLQQRLCGWLSHYIPSKIIYCGNHARQYHENLGFNPAIGFVSYSAVDTSRFYPDEMLRSQGRKELQGISKQQTIGSEPVILLCLARYDPRKDFPNLLAAFALLKQQSPQTNLLLVIVGRGCDAQNTALMSEISKNGLKEADVLLLGYRPDVNRLLNAADILVSASYSEGGPLCVIEALATGTPAVSTDVGDARRLLGDFGYLAPPRNPKALALRLGECLSAIKDKTTENQNLAKLRLEYAKSQSIEAKAKQYQQVHHALVSRRL